MNAPSHPWSAPKVSRLWSAKGDDRCTPPRSDDYKDWSLMQLKREITQRQLKTNPRRRNKDAFVRVLLSSDQAQTQTQNAPQNQQQTLEEPVLFVPAPASELQNLYVNNGDQQQQQQQQQGVYSGGQPQPRQHELYNGGQPQQRQDVYMEHQPQQQEVYTSTGEPQQQQNFVSSDVNVGVMQAAPLTPPAPAPQVQAQCSTQSPVAVAAVAVSAPVASESEVETRQCFQTSKRQRTGQDSEGGENAPSASAVASDATRNGNSAQQVGKGSTEYLRRKLSIQAARLEIESRRLDLESKREQRSNELHAVQLALAKEQLLQAKMTTQKMKTEWMLEQMIQKKRLSDAGISPEDSTTLGMFLS
ncbi:hypothetical protein PHYPSEUDO_000152 [Phytophthora pseudosyringae]|uniref:Uncharacterized protein n=1 Tax=Phytophthora pseudosyringae TaxID=221518 RepID=A0A8T1WL01_9STRA|nr:hypothetical protein PHYPSEUDO_000152 [Phytophthora pseudosyringae]